MSVRISGLVFISGIIFVSLSDRLSSPPSSSARLFPPFQTVRRGRMSPRGIDGNVRSCRSTKTRLMIRAEAASFFSSR